VRYRPEKSRLVLYYVLYGPAQPAFCSTKQQDIHLHLHFQLPLWVSPSPSQIEITAIIGNHFIVKVKGAFRYSDSPSRGVNSQIV